MESLAERQQVEKFIQEKLARFNVSHCRLARCRNGLFLTLSIDRDVAISVRALGVIESSAVAACKNVFPGFLPNVVWRLNGVNAHLVKSEASAPGNANAVETPVSAINENDLDLRPSIDGFVVQVVEPS